MEVKPIRVTLEKLQFLVRSQASTKPKADCGLSLCLVENGGLEETLRKLFGELKYWISHAAKKASNHHQSLHQYEIEFQLGLVDPDTWILNYSQYEGLEECNLRVLQIWFHQTFDPNENYTLHIEITDDKSLVCFRHCMPLQRQTTRSTSRLVHIVEVCVG